ncbi:hypothetical protein HYALB_00001640 [Hymenoscyphus albidus]|uniref:C2H2-type domain-containing protein n=1 Tax=Hymenoscyphus albidus TaxID=595503 RepID=A0A9N9Q2C3_9HELO|nr:hypothetical protein HYALB_00001640 [Hymenoscyphus albidus]
MGGSYRESLAGHPPGSRECWGCGEIFRNGVELYKHCKEFGHFKHAPQDDRFSPPPTRKRFASPIDTPPTRPRGSFREPNNTFFSPPRNRDNPTPNPNTTPLTRTRQPYELYSAPRPKESTSSGAKPPPRAPKEMYPPTRESYDLFTSRNKELITAKPERLEAPSASVPTSIPTLQKSIEPKLAEPKLIEPNSPSAGFMARFRHAALKSDEDLKTELKDIENYWRQKITDEGERIRREKELEMKELRLELEKEKLKRQSEHDTTALREEVEKERSQRKYLEVLSQSYEVLKKVQETRIEQLESANKRLSGDDGSVEKEATSYSSMMEREESQAASKKRSAEEEESEAAKKRAKVWDGKTE